MCRTKFNCKFGTNDIDKELQGLIKKKYPE